MEFTQFTTHNNKDTMYKTFWEDANTFWKKVHLLNTFNSSTIIILFYLTKFVYLVYVC